jgi:hypothetical protein
MCLGEHTLIETQEKSKPSHFGKTYVLWRDLAGNEHTNRISFAPK